MNSLENALGWVQGDSVNKAITLKANGATQSLAGVTSATLAVKISETVTQTATLTVDTVANTLTLSLDAATSASTLWPVGVHAFQIHLVDAGSTRTWPQNVRGQIQAGMLTIAERI